MRPTTMKSCLSWRQVANWMSAALARLLDDVVALERPELPAAVEVAAHHLGEVGVRGQRRACVGERHRRDGQRGGIAVDDVDGQAALRLREAGGEERD
jgi:hypothetical protein